MLDIDDGSPLFVNPSQAGLPLCRDAVRTLAELSIFAPITLMQALKKDSVIGE